MRSSTLGGAGADCDAAPTASLSGFIFGNLHNSVWGWLDRRLVTQHEQRFASEMRTHLLFLFAHSPRFIQETYELVGMAETSMRCGTPPE